MPSGQEMDWAYSITTVPGTHTGHSTVSKVFLPLIWMLITLFKNSINKIIRVSFGCCDRNTDIMNKVAAIVITIIVDIIIIIITVSWTRTAQH